MTERQNTTPHAEGPPPGFAQAALAGSALRSLFYLVPALDPGVPYTPAMIGERLGERQGIHPGWVGHHRQLDSDNTRQCYDKTLVPLGIAIKTTVASKRLPYPVKAYLASNQDLERNMAYAGDTLDWEIQHPLFRRTELLGDVRLNSNYPRAIVSMSVYAAIVNSPTGASAPTNMAGEQLPAKAIDNSVRFYTEAGILVKQSKHQLANRQLALPELDPEYRRNHDRLSPAALAMRETIIMLNRTGRRLIDGETFIHEVVNANPLLDKHHVRRTLTKRPPSFIKFVDEPVYGGKQTRYKIAPHAQTAVADLVHRYQLLQTDTGYRQAAAKRARQIMDDPTLVTFLMAKSAADVLGESQHELWRLDECETIEQRLASLTLQNSEVSALHQQLATAESNQRAILATYVDLPKHITKYQLRQGIGIKSSF